MTASRNGSAPPVGTHLPSARSLSSSTMKMQCPPLSSVRRIERQLRNQALRFVLGGFFNGQIRNTRHFHEWFKGPMNYARIMELPLTYLLLQAERAETILDVSSPKLLALHYALRGYTGVVAADMEDYFVKDFEAYRENGRLAIETAVFDVTKEIPYPDSFFDKMFSVSVIEHIPDDGDSLAVSQMLRVLKPTGSLVITLPCFPYYVEEWTAMAPYWRSVQKDGRTFYQRRYDRDSVLKRLSVPGSAIEEVVLIAERPIEPPRIGEGGRMLHNVYYIDQVPIARVVKTLGRRLRARAFGRQLSLPFTRYLAELIVSRRCHYLTTDWTDPNIRQVVLKVTRAPLGEH